MILVKVMSVEADAAVPAKAAEAMLAASPTGADWTALALMTTTSPLAQPFHGAADALLRGVIRYAKCQANFAKGFVLEVAKQDSGVVFVGEAVQCFVERGADALPVRGGFRIDEELFHGLSFVREPAAVVAQVVERRVAHAAVQPTGEGITTGHFLSQRSGLAGKVGEDALGEVAGEIGRIHLTQRGGIHEICVPGHQFTERGLVAAFGVAPEQFDIGLFVHLTY